LLICVDIAWEDITKIAAKKFPQEVKSGKLSGSHTKKSKPGLSNSSKAEKVLGRKLKPLEAMVTDLAGQYLELLEKS
jgi:predicted transcriptional regulator